MLSSYSHSRSFATSLSRCVNARRFTVLALESSADDTCAAVVTSSREILSNVVVKQNHIHESWGGIHPMYAIKAHQRAMPGAIQKALVDAKLSLSDIDGFAFTRGPGINGCLAVCSSAAKSLAAVTSKPVVGVHHMQAHALTPFLTSPESELPQFPFLTLLVSGGHTLILLATAVDSFKILATTLDSSIGRAFDKVSRMLELRWSPLGPGAALEEFAAGASGDSTQALWTPFPRVMQGRSEFSFSAPHSHVERCIVGAGGIEKLDESMRRLMARDFQTSAVLQLEDKIKLALVVCEKENEVDVRDLVVSGGVASNSFLRTRLRECLNKCSPEKPIALNFPPPSLCTDNAAMIAWASMYRFAAREHDDYTTDYRAKWSIEDLNTPAPPGILDQLAAAKPFTVSNP